MLYSVPQVASLLNVSKQSIYTKLKLSLYSDKIIMKYNQTMIDDTLLKLIKDNLKFSVNNAAEPLESQVNTDDIMINSESINMNKEMFDLMKSQLEEKDNQLIAKDLQINDYSERLKQAHKLIENNQILLKEKPKQDILLLEEHFEDLDIKIEEIKENIQQRKNHQKSKSFFSKLFVKNDKCE